MKLSFIALGLSLLASTSTMAQASDCVSTLTSEDFNYSLVVAESACTGNDAVAADRCLKKLSSSPFNYSLVVAGHACAGGNLPKVADMCLKGVTSYTGFSMVVAARACGFGASTEDALGCLARELSGNRMATLLDIADTCFGKSAQSRQSL